MPVLPYEGMKTGEVLNHKAEVYLSITVAVFNPADRGGPEQWHESGTPAKIILMSFLHAHFVFFKLSNPRM